MGLRGRKDTNEWVGEEREREKMGRRKMNGHEEYEGEKEKE